MEIDNNVRLQVPINVAMQEPRSRVVRSETERDIVTGASDAHDITANRVGVVVRRASSNAHDVKSMTMEMERMLQHSNKSAFYSERASLNIDRLYLRSSHLGWTPQ